MVPDWAEGRGGEGGPPEGAAAEPPRATAADVGDGNGDGPGGEVWIVLFGGVMALSVAANVLLTAAVLSNRKKHTVVYATLVFLFGLNLLEYAVLIFDFSLGVEHAYPYGATTCAAYQVLVGVGPVVQAWTVLLTLWRAAGRLAGTARDGPLPRGGVLRGAARALVPVAAVALAAAPPALFASLVTVRDVRYCAVDLRSVAPEEHRQRAISLFYLLYAALLSYWLPLWLGLRPLCALWRASSDHAKRPEVAVVAATGASFFVLSLGHGGVVLARHFLDAWGDPLSPGDAGALKLAQSFFYLVTFFWHVARPALAVLLDPDLKADLAGLLARGTHRDAEDETAALRPAPDVAA